MNEEMKIRSWRKTDLDNLVKYANNWNIAKYLTDKFPHPYTVADGERFIDFASNRDPVQLFAIEINGEAAGGIGLQPQEDIHRKNAELGYWLAEPYWGRGIITKAIKEMVEFGFMTYDIGRIFARPFGSNIGSQRVLEKAGFKLEAKFEKTIIKNGNYEDEYVYAIRRGSHS